MDEPRKRYAGMMSGLDIHYDLGDGHPLLGRRMPDLDLVTADGPQRRVHAAARGAAGAARPRRDRPPGGGEGGASGRRDYAGGWELPVVGAVAAPGAVLVRPDGHVAWVGDRTG